MEMTSPLDETNPYGIRVVANRAPIREDVRAAFVKGSHKAATGIDQLVHPGRRRSAAVKRAK
jgi:hypothetical protein